jgi:hypothetical protein
MARVWEALDRAYYLIEANLYADAQSILDQILVADPQNVEAWNAYIRSCKTRRELESLRNNIIRVWKTRVRDDYLHAKQRFVLQRLDEKLNAL